MSDRALIAPAPTETDVARAPSLRRILKRVAFGVSIVLVSPLLLLVWLEKRWGTGDLLFSDCSQLLALVPGRVGVQLRAAYYYGCLDQCSWEVHIGFGTIFTHRAASLGTHASMGAYCVIGHADIEADVMMGSRVSIPSGKRQHLDEAGRLSSAGRFDRVRIGRGSWIGEGAIVMADVGAACVVGAGTVLAQALPPACRAHGNPARVVKHLS